MPLLSDPVCGTIVDSTQAVAKTRHNHHLYFFCSEACKQTFEQHPERYIGNAARRPEQTVSPPPNRVEHQNG